MVLIWADAPNAMAGLAPIFVWGGDSGAFGAGSGAAGPGDYIVTFRRRRR